MKDIRGEIPPDCDQGFELDHEMVLAANDVQVVFDEDEGYWSLVWKHGVMGIGQCPKSVAREAAGLFIYLWLKYTPAPVADKIMAAWVCSRCNEERIDRLYHEIDETRLLCALYGLMEEHPGSQGVGVAMVQRNAEHYYGFKGDFKRALTVLRASKEVHVYKVVGWFAVPTVQVGVELLTCPSCGYQWNCRCFAYQDVSCSKCGKTFIPMDEE